MHTRTFGFIRSLVTALSVVTILVGAVGPVPVLASRTVPSSNYVINAAPVGTWCVAGSFNNWNNNQDVLADDGQGADLIAGDGVFSRSVSIAASGGYQWKVVKCEDWSTAFPSANSWFHTTAINQAVMFTFDTNDHG